MLYTVWYPFLTWLQGCRHFLPSSNKQGQCWRMVAGDWLASYWRYGDRSWGMQYILHTANSVVNCLQVPNSAQQLMSHKTLPVLSCAVPTIETLIVQWEHLSTHLPQCAPYIKVGLEYANKYYSCMDKTNAYVIVMCKCILYSRIVDSPLFIVVDPTLHLTWMEEHWSSAEVLKVHHVVLEKVDSYLFWSLRYWTYLDGRVSAVMDL